MGVQVARPENEAIFRKFDIEGIEVYLQKGMRLQGDNVRIYLKKVMFMKWLEVQGVEPW